MVVKLNMILITSPELSEFRRRLKSLETRVRYESSCVGSNLTTVQQDGETLPEAMASCGRDGPEIWHEGLDLKLEARSATRDTRRARRTEWLHACDVDRALGNIAQRHMAVR